MPLRATVISTGPVRGVLDGHAAEDVRFLSRDGTTGAMLAALDLGLQRLVNQGFAIVTPTALTGVQVDNYDVGVAEVVRQDASANTNISGLIAGGVLNLALFNISGVAARTLTLLHESASSTAANRFLCPGNANLALTNNSAVFLSYDAVSERWRVNP